VLRALHSAVGDEKAALFPLSWRERGNREKAEPWRALAIQQLPYIELTTAVG
jgi:hypothetical protein